MALGWVNPCVATHLSEEEIEQTRAFPNHKHLTLEKQAESDQLHREAEIPCGSRLQASWKIRTCITTLQRSTFFLIPVFDGPGGGSGYMEITPFPFL